MTIHSLNWRELLNTSSTSIHFYLFSFVVNAKRANERKTNGKKERNKRSNNDYNYDLIIITLCM